MNKKRDIVLILEGGAMSGIFGAGVVSALEKANIYDHIDRIYAVSAGAQIGAYFLSKKIVKATEIYSKYLPSKRYKFIEKMSTFKILKKLFDLIIYKKNMHVLDLEILKQIQRTKSKLDIKTIKNSKIDFYVRVFDVKNMEMKYINGKRNTLEAINISSYMPPYIYLKTRYKYYFDGQIVPSNDFIEIIKKHKDKKIIYILNEKRTLLRKIKDIPFKLIDFFLKSIYHGIDFMTYHMVHFLDTPTIADLKKYENVYLVYPKMNTRKITVNTKKLRELYNHGIKRGEEVIKQLDL
jgi:predicted patatin/cPLA2 family phospholipase